VAKARSSEGDLFHSDLGQGLYYRDGMFDGAISVSTLQWLCSCPEKCHNPWRRLHRFFESLFRCLKRGSRYRDLHDTTVPF
jgi:18S rRNA (guanine1575-N7)-methyltransferase